MSPRRPENIPHLPTPEELGLDAARVEEMEQERLANALVSARIEQDPEKMDVVTRGRAAEQAIDLGAQGEAIQHARNRQEEERRRREQDFPWGVAHLRDREELSPRTEDDKQADLEEIYRRIEKATGGSKARGEDAEYKAEVLTGHAHDEREVTLGFGRKIAERLREEGKEPDTEIFIQGTKEKTKWFAFDRYGGDKLRTKVEVPTYKPYNDDGHPNRGWLLEDVKDARGGVTKAVLLEDGSILVAVSARLTKAADRADRHDPEAKRYEDEEKKFTKHRLDIHPNQASRVVEQKRKDMTYLDRVTKKAPGLEFDRAQIYSWVIDENLHSDLGLPSMASIGAVERHSVLMDEVDEDWPDELKKLSKVDKDAPELAITPEEAKTFFARERAMQHGLVSILIRKGVALERETEDTDDEE